MTSYAVLDDLVKEYILYRGFAATLKAFDNDLKIEKEKAFRAERHVSWKRQLTLVLSDVEHVFIPE